MSEVTVDLCRCGGALLFGLDRVFLQDLLCNLSVVERVVDTSSVTVVEVGTEVGSGRKKAVMEECLGVRLDGGAEGGDVGRLRLDGATFGGAGTGIGVGTVGGTWEQEMQDVGTGRLTEVCLVDNERPWTLSVVADGIVVVDSGTV